MLTALRVGLATLALAAIGQQLVIHIGASYSVLNFFSYFTNLSNLFAAVVLLLSVLSPPHYSAVVQGMWCGTCPR